MDDIIAADHVIAMDHKVLNRTKAICSPEEEKKVVLLSTFSRGEWEEVPDPWYTGDLDLAYDLICEGCTGVLQQVKAELAEESGKQ